MENERQILKANEAKIFQIAVQLTKQESKSTRTQNKELLVECITCKVLGLINVIII